MLVWHLHLIAVRVSVSMSMGHSVCMSISMSVTCSMCMASSMSVTCSMCVGRGMSMGCFVSVSGSMSMSSMSMGLGVYMSMRMCMCMMNISQMFGMMALFEVAGNIDFMKGNIEVVSEHVIILTAIGEQIILKNRHLTLNFLQEVSCVVPILCQTFRQNECSYGIIKEGV